MKRMKDCQPKISVIIPMYNMAAYIERCLDSVIAGPYKNLEILCVYHTSEDTSAEIIASYIDMDDRIKRIDCASSHLSDLRNCGLDRMTGEYVVFVDCDDWLHPQFFEILYQVLNENQADMAMSAFVRTKEQPPFDYESHSIETRCLSVCEMMRTHDKKSFVWRRLYRKELFEKVRFQRLAIEDAAFMIDLVSQYNQLKIVYADIVLYGYYQRGDSLLRKIDYNDVLNLVRYEADAISSITEKEMCGIIATEVVKNSLSARYGCRLHGQKEREQECNQLLNKTIPKVNERRYLYWIFYFCPGLYRWYRIKNDPSLKKMEMNIKRKA